MSEQSQSVTFCDVCTLYWTADDAEGRGASDRVKAETCPDCGRLGRTETAGSDAWALLLASRLLRSINYDSLYWHYQLDAEKLAEWLKLAREGAGEPNEKRWACQGCGCQFPKIEHDDDVKFCTQCVTVEQQALRIRDLEAELQHAETHRCRSVAKAVDGFSEKLAACEAERNEARTLVSRLSRALGNETGSTTLWREARDFIARCPKRKGGAGS